MTKGKIRQVGESVHEQLRLLRRMAEVIEELDKRAAGDSVDEETRTLVKKETARLDKLVRELTEQSFRTGKLVLENAA